MTVVNPYLNFEGKTEEAFNFYRSVFGGEFATIMRYKDIPDGVPKPEGDDVEKIMHIALPIGTSVLMGSDTPEVMGPLTKGNNFTVSIGAASEEEARRIYDALSTGGTIEMPLEKAFWGALFGMFIDKYGVNWMISYDAQRL